jgi:hypothetical protein
MVSQLKQAYAGRANFKLYMLDQMTPAQYEEVRPIADGAGVHRTPTFLIVDRHGRVVSKFEGATSYMSLARELDRVLAPQDSL